MRAVLLFASLLFAMLGISMVLFGAWGMLPALLLFFWITKGAPVKWEDIEAVLIILAFLGIIVSFLSGFPISDIAGPYY